MNRFRPREQPGAGARRRGVAGVEFALLVPLLLVLLLAGADAVLWLRTRVAAEHVAAQLALITAREDQLYEGDFAGLFAAGQSVAGTIRVSAPAGALVLTGLVSTGNATRVAWQRRSGSSLPASRFAGGVLPGGWIPQSGQTIIAAEVFTSDGAWAYSAAVLPAAVTTIAAYALQQPRAGLLDTITPGRRP